MFLRRWLSVEAIEEQGIQLDNCAVLKYQYDEGVFTFVGIHNLP